MLTYIARRLAWTVVVLLAVLLVTFAVFFLMPNGDPALRFATMQFLAVYFPIANTAAIAGRFVIIQNFVGAIPAGIEHETHPGLDVVTSIRTRSRPFIGELGK